MTRFDAESEVASLRDPSVASASHIVAAHPGVFVLSIALAGLTIAGACVLLLFGQVVRVQLARTIDAVQLSVFLQPQSSRADAEALRERIVAVPAVGNIRLRTREDAWTTLTAATMPALAYRANPLPDVWVVSLRPSSAEASKRPLSTRLADTRAALAGLPGVESVRVDTSWAELLDRWSSWIEPGVAYGTGAVVCGLLAFLFGVFLLAGRAATPLRQGAYRVQALATVGAVTAMSSLIFCGILLAAAGFSVPILTTTVWPVLASLGTGGQAFLVGSGLAVIVVAALASVVGGTASIANADEEYLESSRELLPEHSV